MPKIKISEDEFKEWLDHPVTEWVFAAVRKHAEAQQEAVGRIMWETGEANQRLLDEARLRADCYNALPETTYEDWSELNDPKA